MILFYLRKCHCQNYKGKLRSDQIKFKVAAKEALERKSPFAFWPWPSFALNLMPLSTSLGCPSRVCIVSSRLPREEGNGGRGALKQYSRWQQVRQAGSSFRSGGDKQQFLSEIQFQAKFEDSVTLLQSLWLPADLASGSP